MKHFVLGDIHGCYYTLIDLINKLPIESDDKLVFVGDYIDRGPHSRLVVEYVESLTEEGTAIALKGNHEDMCVYAQRMNDNMLWVHNGGLTTLKSFCGDPLPDKAKIPEEILDWMDNLPLTFETDDYFVCHAGIDPDYPLNQQDPDDLIWIRNKFLNDDTFDVGKKVVFGHSAFKEGPWIKENKIGIDTGCVYGLNLTAFCLETFEFYTVPKNERDKNEI